MRPRIHKTSFYEIIKFVNDVEIGMRDLIAD